MAEWRLFDPADGTPECATAEWYADRDTAPHLEQEGHRERLYLTARYVKDAMQDNAGSVVDLGAGDGGLLALLTGSLVVPVNAWGYDLQPANVDHARDVRGVDVRLGNFLTDPVELADVVVATEVLEHLVDPHAVVRWLAAHGTPRWLVASSPYTETDAAHYEHHLWAWDRPGYEQMLTDAGWRVVKSDTAWICQVVLAERDV